VAKGELGGKQSSTISVWKFQGCRVEKEFVPSLAKSESTGCGRAFAIHSIAGSNLGLKNLEKGRSAYHDIDFGPGRRRDVNKRGSQKNKTRLRRDVKW